MVSQSLPESQNSATKTHRLMGLSKLSSMQNHRNESKCPSMQCKLTTHTHTFTNAHIHTQRPVVNLPSAEVNTCTE